MKKWKCKKCGEIYESETKPAKCTSCESDEIIEFIETSEIKKPNDVQPVVNDNDFNKKQFENMQKQIDMIKGTYETKIKVLEEELKEEKNKHLTEAQKKELEKQKFEQKALEKESEMLSLYEETKKRLEDLEKTNKAKEFENRKLREKTTYYYIAEQIEKCETPEQLDFLYKITDLKKVKAEYDAKKNGSGSVINIQGAKPVEETKPSTLGQKLQAKVNQRLEEIKNKK